MYFQNFSLHWGLIIYGDNRGEGAEGRGERDYSHLPLHSFLFLFNIILDIN